jgi:hypothetical protein
MQSNTCVSTDLIRKKSLDFKKFSFYLYNLQKTYRIEFFGIQ